MTMHDISTSRYRSSLKAGVGAHLENCTVVCVNPLTIDSGSLLSDMDGGAQKIGEH